MSSLYLENSGVNLVVSKISALSDVTADNDLGTHYVEVCCDGIQYQEHFHKQRDAVKFHDKVFNLMFP